MKTIAALVGLFALAQPAMAAPGPFFSWPENDYPPHTKAVYLNHTSGMATDCAINFDCNTGTSFTHSREQDFFHRVDGQIEGAETSTAHSEIIWGATLQSYETADYAAAAMADVLKTTTILNASGLRFHEVAPPFPSTDTVAVEKLKLYGPVVSITLLIAQDGVTETEIGAAYDNKHRALAQKYLLRQFNESLRQMADQVAP